MSNNSQPPSRAPSYSSKTTRSMFSTSSSTSSSSNNNNTNMVVKREPSTDDLVELEHEDEEEQQQQQQQLNALNTIVGQHPKQQQQLNTVGQQKLNAPNTIVGQLPQQQQQQQLNALNMPNNYCITCNRTFAGPKGLKHHNTKLHDPKNLPKGEFQCSQCPYRSGKSGNLDSHMRSAHPAVVKEKPKKITTARAKSISVKKPPTKITSTRAKSINAKEKPPTKINATRAKSISAKKQPTRAMPKPTDQQQQPGTSAAAYAPQRQQVKKRGGRRARANAEDDDDELEVIQPSPEKKPAGRPRQLIPRNQFGAIDSGPGGFGTGSAVISHYAGMVINACAQSNLVTFHDVDTMRGTIGQITFQFQCNECRGERGVARCSLGRPYCVVCCGHAECD